MCEYISFLASTEGSLQIYAAPNLNSHGEARAGWKIKGGAECEWVGEGPESLSVRFEDEAVRKVVRAIILEKYASRKELLKEITETRNVNGDCYWFKNGVFGRDGDLPAVECADGDRYWYKDDKLGRDGDLPAVECANGTREWYKDGKQHRDGDKPAVERADGTRKWYKDDKLHRDGDLPAVEYANGGRCWHKDDKLGRDGDLPAVVEADGTRKWYRNGVGYTPKQK